MNQANNNGDQDLFGQSFAGIQKNNSNISQNNKQQMGLLEQDQKFNNGMKNFGMIPSG